VVLRRRWLAVAVALVAVCVLTPGAGASAGSCWLPPVAGAVADPYRAPACRWCPGNRGIEYSLRGTAVVRAVATGVVTFSDVVAGTRYVVVDIGAGRLITYGRLASAVVRTGDRVVVRSPIGAATSTLYFGLRVHGDYADPTPYLGVLVGRPRLVPTDGSAARPAPPPVLRCAAGARLTTSSHGV
jgi:murein DD-endopeptidase MepM/ murein hydrolase activator NlpD